mgnify:CR=1 FL=1
MAASCSSAFSVFTAALNWETASLSCARSSRAASGVKRYTRLAGQERPDVVDLDDLFPAELGDRRAAVRDHLAMSRSRLQDPQHLAQRRPADLQLSAGIGLDELLTGPELALR